MTRRLLALCATASMATLANAGTAHADPSGFVSVGAGFLQKVYDSGMSTFTEDGYAAEGRASGVYQFTPVLGAQGDVVLALDHLETDFSAFDRSSIDIALHGFYRDPERFLVGTFAQFGRDTLDYGGLMSTSWDRTYLGGEAQVFVQSLTLYAQGGMQKVAPVDISGPEVDGLFGSLEARYFLTPDFRIDAHAGLSTLTYDIGPGWTATTLNLGVGAEYRLENLPVSLFAKYDCFTTTFSDAPAGYSMDDHRFMIGAKFGIGEDSLLDRDRNGSSLKPVETRSFFGGIS
jgi:hypothetical protein